jgi:hypothetical protein
VVSRPVCFDVRHASDPHGQFLLISDSCRFTFVGRPLWGEDGSYFTVADDPREPSHSREISEECFNKGLNPFLQRKAVCKEARYTYTKNKQATTEELFETTFYAVPCRVYITNMSAGLEGLRKTTKSEFGIIEMWMLRYSSTCQEC